MLEAFMLPDPAVQLLASIDRVYAQNEEGWLRMAQQLAGTIPAPAVGAK